MTESFTFPCCEHAEPVSPTGQRDQWHLVFLLFYPGCICLPLYFGIHELCSSCVLDSMESTCHSTQKMSLFQSAKSFICMQLFIPLYISSSVTLTRRYGVGNYIFIPQNIFLYYNLRANKIFAYHLQLYLLRVCIFIKPKYLKICYKLRACGFGSYGVALAITNKIMQTGEYIAFLSKTLHLKWLFDHFHL